MTQRHNLQVLPQQFDALLVANGFAMPRAVLQELGSRARRIIALDGGCAQCKRAAVIPHILLGDLDSVRAADLEWARGNNVKIIRLAGQEMSDVQKGLSYAMTHACKQVVLASVGGSRLDHTLAIMQHAEELHTLKVYLLSAETIALPLRGRAAIELELNRGTNCSWISRNEAKGCSMSGVSWPFRERRLGTKGMCSLSNVVSDPPLRASQRSGMSWLMVQLAR